MKQYRKEVIEQNRVYAAPSLPINGQSESSKWMSGLCDSPYRSTSMRGEDKPYNMQWQTKEEAKIKEIWDRKNCH